MDFGNQIKSRRKELNLTLKEVSIYVGVAEATVQRWESGNIKTIKGDKLNKLATILRVPVEELTSWIDGKKPTQEDFERWERELNPNGKLAREVDALELFEQCYGKEVYTAVSKFLKLDATDRTLISSMMNTMLNQDKYSIQEESKHA